MQNGPGTDGQLWHKSGTSCSPDVHGGENENPGALAGATGAETQSVKDLANNSPNGAPEASLPAHENAARLYGDIVGVLGVLRAVFEINPADRLTVLESVYADLCAGPPAFAADQDAMAWAKCWAAIASRAERKAYALACFEALGERDQQAFLAYVTGRAAA